MEFIINSECFNKAISDVNKAVSLKTPFPILSGIKITANKDCLILVGSNSDIIIEKVIPLTIDGVKVLEVNETGSVVLSAKYLSEIVKKLPDKIHLEEEIKLSFGGSMRPVLIEPVENTSYLHLISPVRSY